MVGSAKGWLAGEDSSEAAGGRVAEGKAWEGVGLAAVARAVEGWEVVLMAGEEERRMAAAVVREAAGWAGAACQRAWEVASQAAVLGWGAASGEGRWEGTRLPALRRAVQNSMLEGPWDQRARGAAGLAWGQGMWRAQEGASSEGRGE